MIVNHLANYLLRGFFKENRISGPEIQSFDLFTQH